MPNESYRPSAFISYRAEGSDLEIAGVLRVAFAKNEIRVPAWRDKEDLVLGTENLRELEKGIAQSAYFVQLLSARSLESPWCQRERIFALQEGKRIIPVKLEKVSVPLEIIELQYLTMFHGVAKALPTILSTMGLTVRNPDVDKDPLDRDDRRIESFAHLCYVLGSHGGLAPIQVLILAQRMAGDCLETDRALAVVEEVAQLFHGERITTARQIGDALKQRWNAAD